MLILHFDNIHPEAKGKEKRSRRIIFTQLQNLVIRYIEMNRSIRRSRSWKKLTVHGKDKPESRNKRQRTKSANWNFKQT